MNDVLSKQLENFGLSEKEARIYVALTELEIATANQIAEHADLKRSSTYVVLDSLIAKGLVSISEDKTVKRYVATNPEILLRETEQEIRAKENLKETLKNILPELKALHKETKRRPKVRVFEGVNGLREVYYEMFETNAKELRVYTKPDNIFRLLPDFKEQNAKRMERGMKMFAINPKTLLTGPMMKGYPRPSEDEFISIPKEHFRFNIDMGIYGDRVAFASTKDKFGIIIENAEIAELLKNGFDLSWEGAKQIGEHYTFDSK